MHQPIISVNHLTKDFGNQSGIFDLTFDIQAGEVFGYLGPNGSGKSTTIRHLMGFIKPDLGTCSIFQEDAFTCAHKIQPHVGYLAGEIAFMEDLTAKQYLKLIYQLKKMKDDTRMRELIQRFDVKMNIKIKKMSKGMKQKLAIVAAFMNSPKLLILDEPTSGLDPLMQATFIQLLEEEKQRGTTIFISSHMLEEVQKVCDRVAILKEGSIIKIIDMKPLLSLKRKRIVVLLQDELEAKRLYHNSLIKNATIQDNQISISNCENLKEMISIIQQYHYIDLTIQDVDLEELFFDYYGGKGDE